MRLFAVLFSLSLPAAALAQSESVQITIGNAESTDLAATDCGATLPISYVLPAAAASTACSSFTIWLTAGDCGEKAATGETIVHTRTRTGTQLTPLNGSFNLAVSSLPAFAGDAGACGTGAGTEISYLLCGGFEYGGLSGCATNPPVVTDTTPPVINFDSKPPTAPVATSIDAHDGSLSLHLTIDDDTDVIIVTARNLDAEGQVTQEFTRSTRVTVDNLKNGMDYRLSAVARDAAGNESPPSNELDGQPVATGGFFQRYEDAGGSVGTGCAAAGVGSFGALGLLAAVRLVLRRRVSP